MKISRSFYRSLALTARFFTALGIFCVAAMAQADTRLAATWQVVKYDINVTMPASDTARDITARAAIEMRNVSGRPANSLTLRISPNATIASATLNGNAADPTSAEEKIGAVSLQRVAFRLPSVQPGGTLSVVVDYKLAVRENSGLSAISPAGSQFLPMSFWYPTPNSWFFARGADYAPVRLKVNQPAGKTVISSGREADGGFDQSLNVQPFFVTGSWDRADHSGVTVYLPKGVSEIGRKNAAELGALVSEARAYFTEFLGAAPQTEFRIVASERGSGFSSGGTVLVERALFSRQKIDAATALSISEAVARVWLGESIRATGEGYGIIREGLPRHLANKFFEKKYGQPIADMERARQRIGYSAVSRRDGPLNLVAPLDDFYFTAVANKGAMFWRLLERKVGTGPFYEKIKANSQSGVLTMPELRSAFSDHKEFLDQMLDQSTETNLLAGLPQVTGAETKVALRNTGGIDVTVNVKAFAENGQSLTAPVTVRAKSFGEVIFRSPSKITRVEVDPEKLYPQTDYSDDIAPRETTDSDLLLAVKRDFDRQAYSEAEKTARSVLRWWPHFDDVRVLLGRSLLAQNRILDAEREFRAVVDETLPMARSMGWALVGLADAASRTGRNDDAGRYIEQAIKSEPEYGAALLGRNIRNRLNRPANIDDAFKSYFIQFDRAAISNRKADVEALVMPGEVNRFATSIAGNAVEWRSELKHVDMLDADTALVETNMSVRLLNRETESGLAVYRLARTPAGWRLAAVDIFEVR